jgi:hypothetical protein
MVRPIVLAAALCAAGCGSDEPAIPDLLVDDIAEPAGANCPHGGAAVQSGLDHDGDGTLDDDEVEEVTYACLPAPPAVPTPLVRTRPAPVSAECPSGGTAIDLGVDRDGDGVLDDDEVTSTRLACEVDEVWEGDVGIWVWNDPLALARLREATIVTGEIRIATTGPVSLPRLRTVAGDIWIWSSNGTLDLPLLTEVGGELDLEDADLVGEVRLPALTTIGEDARLGAGTAIDRLSAPALTIIGGSLIVGDWTDSELDLRGLAAIGGDLHAPQAPQAAQLPALVVVDGDVELGAALTTVALPALTTVGGTLALDSPTLATVALPRLRNVGALRVASPLVTTLALPRLTTAGSLQLAAAALATLELPALTAVGAELVVDASALAELRLPALQQAPAVVVGGSPALARIEAPLLAAVDDRLELRGTALADLSGFPQLAAAGDVALVGNPHLVRVDAALTALDGLLLEGNPSLAALDGLAAVTAIEHLHVAGNPALASLEGLHHVATAGDVVIDDNGIVTMEGLRSLHDVAGDLSISGNGALTSLAGLARLSRVGAALGIDGNPQVPADEVAALRARLGL